MGGHDISRPRRSASWSEVGGRGVSLVLGEMSVMLSLSS
jgi:hypothetical protein